MPSNAGNEPHLVLLTTSISKAAVSGAQLEGCSRGHWKVETVLVVSTRVDKCQIHFRDGRTTGADRRY